MKRADVIAAARGWIGTPFRPQQSLKGQGCDCAGLILGIARELAIVSPEFKVPPWRQMPDGTMPKVCKAHLVPVPKLNARPGDIVMMRFEKLPQHLGILVPYRDSILGIVHALMRPAVVAEHRLDPRWKQRIVAAYSFPGVED
jgi:NlpC/P60 family putative phage cell wall peptidase